MASAPDKRGCAATVRACDLCRRRKRRCLWESGRSACTMCTNLDEACTTSHIRKQRARPQRDNRIAEYESRVQTLESLLQECSAEQPQLDQQPLKPADDPKPVMESVANLHDTLGTIARPDLADFETLLFEDFTDSPKLPHSGQVRNHVSNPGERQGRNQHGYQVNCTSEATKSWPTLNIIASPLEDIHVNRVARISEHDSVPPILPSLPICDGYLPSPDLGTALLSEFLVDFNTAHPLYQPHDISNHLRICYAGEADEYAISWTSAYVVFGIAHTLRAMSTTATAQDMEFAKFYVFRVHSYLMQRLLTSPPTLGLVQCLIGAAKLIRSTQCGCSLTDAPLLSTSIRVAQSLAYHEEEAELPNCPRDIAQERRVFWLSFICDTYTAIAANTPATHRREDLTAPKPDEDPSDNVGAIVAAEGIWKVNFFSLRVNLAFLQAEAVEQVLSAKARNKAVDVEAAAVAVLARLKRFHSHELFTLSCDQLFQLLYRSDIAHIVSLEAGYFMTVHRLQAFLAFDKDHRVNPFSLEGMLRLSEIPEQKTYPEARRLLSLLSIAPRGDVSLYWNEYKAFQVALVTVLTHHLRATPAVSQQGIDLDIYRQLVADLGILCQKSGNVEMTQTRVLCVTLLSTLDEKLSIV